MLSGILCPHSWREQHVHTNTLYAHLHQHTLAALIVTVICLRLINHSCWISRQPVRTVRLRPPAPVFLSEKTHTNTRPETVYAPAGVTCHSGDSVTVFPSILQLPLTTVKKTDAAEGGMVETENNNRSFSGLLGAPAEPLTGCSRLLVAQQEQQSEWSN